MSKHKKVLIYNDTHFPFQDDKVLKLIKKFALWFKPDIIVHAGDLIDAYPISHFTKDPLDTHSLMDEIKLAKAHLKEFRKLTNEYYYIEGNHEARLNKFISQHAPEIADLMREGQLILSLPYLLELDKIGVKYVKSIGKEAILQLNELYIGHFNKVSKHSCYTAKALVEERGVSVIQAHTHRLGKHYKTTFSGTFVGIENGCTCNLHPKYVANPNWQHGFSVALLDSNGKRFQVYDIPIVDYKFWFGDKKFSI